jgi:DeoR family lactose phosphotransferase system repressor
MTRRYCSQREQGHNVKYTSDDGSLNCLRSIVTVQYKQGGDEMFKGERREAICHLIDEMNTVTTGEIAEKLSVSEMTVRRDLAELSDDGRVVRVHGGARSIAGVRGTAIPRELTHREKGNAHGHEKAQIAAEALAYIDEGSTIFLGTGTTVEMLARVLPLMHLRVITNSLPVIDALCNREGIDLYVVGGAYRASTGAFVGPLAEQAIATLGIDTAFIGLNGIFEHVVSTSNTPKGCCSSLPSTELISAASLPTRVSWVDVTFWLL